MSLSVNILKAVEQRQLLNKGKVLVVDEDHRDSAYYKTILQQAGWRVVTCPSYRDATACLESELFDLVVVSQGTCAFEGRPVLERALDLDPGRPVLVVARSLQMDCYLEAMRLGAADYLEEPVTEQEIFRAAEGYFRAGNIAA